MTTTALSMSASRTLEEAIGDDVAQASASGAAGAIAQRKLDGDCHPGGKPSETPVRGATGAATPSMATAAATTSTAATVTTSLSAAQYTVLRTIKGADGFMCGETPDYVKVTCWTVGVHQQSYRQANHRSRDGSIWRLFGGRLDDDPPRFVAHQVGTGRGETFDAFTGEELGWQVEVPRLLVTETTS